jgi:hypothetical protein
MATVTTQSIPSKHSTNESFLMAATTPINKPSKAAAGVAHTLAVLANELFFSKNDTDKTCRNFRMTPSIMALERSIKLPFGGSLAASLVCFRPHLGQKIVSAETSVEHEAHCMVYLPIIIDRLIDIFSATRCSSTRLKRS